MEQHNMPCTSQMTDLEIEPPNPDYRHPAGFVALPSVPQPHNQALVPASGSRNSVDVPHMPDQYDNGIYYGLPEYHGVQHHPHHHTTNLDLGVATTSNFYFPYATPAPGAAIGHGSCGQLPSSSSFGAVGIPTDDYGTNGILDGSRSSYKRKNADGNPNSVRQVNPSASSSSSVPLSTRHPDGVSTTDEASLSISQHRGIDTGTLSIREVGPHRSVRNRLGSTGLDPILTHHQNHIIGGTYIGQPYQPPGAPWLDHQLNNHCDASGSAWTQTAIVPYVHGNNVNSMQTRSLASPQYHEQASNRSNANFLQPSSIDIQQHNLRHLFAPYYHGMRTHNPNFHPQVSMPSFGLPMGFSSGRSLNPSHDGLDVGLRHPRSVQPTGFRIYRSHRDGVIPNATPRHRNLPQLRVLPSDGVALLEFPNYREISNNVDHHRDMRMDIEDMSYEELLALGELIGNVNTGVSEEIIESQLKTKTYSASPAVNVEPSMDQELESCIICQDPYRAGEQIGILECKHQYHAECLKKWLHEKNVCPICKLEALATKKDV